MRTTCDTGKTLTIHGVKPEFFGNRFNLANYTLTFDDGLYSQYFYWEFFKDISVEKIFFIPTNLICVDGLGKRKKWNGKMLTFPNCFEALHDFRKTGNRENYMRIEELRELVDDGVTIGAHGHNHIKYYDTFSAIRNDIERMMDWFMMYLGIVPQKYAFPHYEETPVVKRALIEAGFTEFYGKERIEIEEEINILFNV